MIEYASVIVLFLTFSMYRFYGLIKRKRKFEKCLENIPGPPPYPVIGNSLEFGSSKDILHVLSKFQFKYGSIFKLSAGFSNFMLVSTDQDFCKFLLSSKTILEKSTDYDFLHKWLGTGLLTGGGKKWKQHRRIITPAFHYHNLERYIEVFNTETNILIEKLKTEIGNNSTDIYPYITLCSLDIICRSITSVSMQSQEHKNDEYVQCVKEMCRILIDRAFSAIKMNDFLYKFSRDCYKEKSAIKIVHGYSNAIIKSRKTTDEDSKTLLDLLLESNIDGEALSKEEIREEIDTFLFAGHDTVASATSFALFCLSNHQDVQLNVLKELKMIFSDGKYRAVTYKDLMEMRYLVMVIKESLRLYPSVPFYSRRIEEDTFYGDLLLPKDLLITVFAYGAHRDPNVYPKPEIFDPERFRSENNMQRSTFSYLPFSAGLRNCIGQKFAMLEMKCIISRVLMNYELTQTSPKHELVMVSETTLKSANGIKMRLKKYDF